MGTLLRNEFVKIMHRKKTFIVLLAFIALVAVLAFSDYKNVEVTKMYNNIDFRIKNIEENIKNMKEEKEDPKVPANQKRYLDDSIASEELQLKILKDEKEKGVTKDWKDEIKENIKQMEEQRDKDTKLSEEDKKIINEDIKYQQYFLDNNIKPDDGLKVEAFSFLEQAFSVLGMIFLGIGIAVFAADIVSGEYTPPTAKVLLTQPVSRGKVLLSKYISIVLSSVVLITLVEFVAFIIVGLIFEFGDPIYPVQVGTKLRYDTMNLTNQGYNLKPIAGTTHIIPMWKYTIEMFLMQILYIIACVSFVFLTSTVLKSSMISISFSTVVIITLSIFQNMPGIKKIMPYIFLSYGDVNAVLSGGIAQTFNNPSMTSGFSILVLVLWTVISYAISHIVFVDKDILI